MADTLTRYPYLLGGIMEHNAHTVTTDGETLFPAHHVSTETRWNGFAIPYFTREEANRVAAWTATLRAASPFGDDSELVSYDPVRDAFGAESQGETEWFYGIPCHHCNVTVYPIGAFGWVWQEVN